MRRSHYEDLLARKLRGFPAVVLLGPRQAGKSSLAATTSGKRTVFDLERPSDLARLRAAPEDDLGDLQRRPGTIVIDEIQREPSLFALLRPLIDDKKRRARYLLLGSASPTVVAGVSESLAGRAGFVDLTPFLACEAGTTRPRLNRLWVRGGFPRSFLARSDEASVEWREAYVRALLERDLPALRPGIPVATISRLLTMIAHLHGSPLNESELAGSLGLSAPTVGRYIDILEGLFVVRRLPPYFANISKRLTKAPRIYVRDSGLLHALLGIPDNNALRSHPKAGASWEGFVIEQVVGALAAAGETVRAAFWRTSGGAEVDLILERGTKRVAVEVKLGTPSVSRGFHECMKDLKCRGVVIHGGVHDYPMSPIASALSVSATSDVRRLVKALFG